ARGNSGGLDGTRRADAKNFKFLEYITALLPSRPHKEPDIARALGREGDIADILDVGIRVMNILPVHRCIGIRRKLNLKRLRPMIAPEKPDSIHRTDPPKVDINPLVCAWRALPESILAAI